jgi:parallel beta-helix repeat protein
VSAIDVDEVTVRHCHLRGFHHLLHFQRVPHARIEENTLQGDPYGVLYAIDTPGLRVRGNTLIGPGANSLIAYAPETIVTDNHFDPASDDPREYVSVSLYGSPGSTFAGNVGAGSTYVSFSNHSDGAIASDNQLLGGSQIAVGHSSDCIVTRNQIGPVDPAMLYANAGVSLYGAVRNEVSYNEIQGHRVSGIIASGDVTPGVGSDSNRIVQNSIRDANTGIYLFSSNENTISDNQLHETWFGFHVLGLPEEPGSQGNLLQRNSVVGGGYGAFVAFAGGNTFAENTLEGPAWGVIEIRTDSLDREPNVYEANHITGSKLFGLVAWGASPRLFDNRFLDNGSEVYVPDDPSDVLLLDLLDNLRGAVAFLPFVGDPWVTTLDDGDSSDDLLAAPRIGDAGRPNLFGGNLGVDVYGLDSRAENQATLEHDNRFEPGPARPEAVGSKRRRHLRFRQDWFGLVRVEVTSGDEVGGVTVEIRDARGQVAGLLVTGPAGTAPAEQDPFRTQGRIQGEPGGPVPAWPRFTEFIVGENGQRKNLTPHRLSVRSEAGMGRSWYSWDGLENDPLGLVNFDGRYQKALVVLDKRLP